MSYDVWLEIDTGGEEPASVSESLNCTYNCGPMFRKALGGSGIHDLGGKVAGDLLPQLRAAVANITDPAECETYLAMNPPNKWGDHAGAISFLESILLECSKHPKATVKVG